MTSQSAPDQTSSRLTLAALRDLGSATLSEVAAESGLSRPTSEAALRRLAELGLVEHRVDSVLPNRAGGRPAHVSRFRADAGYVAGVDLVGPTIKVAICDLRGQWLACGAGTVKTPTSRRPGLEPLRAAVREAADVAGIDPAALRAVGIGAAGVVRADGTMMTSPFVTPWIGRNLHTEASELLGLPVTVDNDLTLAAMAEARMGALRGVTTAVYAETFYNLTVRCLVDGQVVRGRRRVAGEIGVLKAFASSQHGRRGYFTALQQIEAALQAVQSGQSTAADRAELMRLTKAMAGPLAAVALMTDPDVIALAGPLGRHADLLVPHLRTAIAQASTGEPAFEADIVAAELTDTGVLAGAIDQAFELRSAAVYGVDGVEPPVQSLVPQGAT